MTKLEEIARAICGAQMLASQTTGLNRWGQIMDRQDFVDISWPLYAGHAAKALESMRGYSEAQSQAGGAVGKYDKIPTGPNNPPVGQSIAERAYLAMIDCVLNEKPGGGE